MLLIAGCSTNTDVATNDTAFSHSYGIDENGLWEGIKALDYVELFDYQSMIIPNDVHKISDDDVEYEISNMLSEFSTNKQVTDRAVVDKDMVNIDYVGSIDGVEFDGGNTGGMGTDVTAGSTDYIGDFLTQIIGHMPGETVNVEVTFPDYYPNNSDLENKDALFVTTINYITEETAAELTDDFVATNLSAYYGWSTVEEAKTGVRMELQKNAIQQYILQYFTTDVTIRSIPDVLTKYQEDSMLNYYQGYAEYYDMELTEFLSSYEGFSSINEFVQANADNIMNNAICSFVIQAVVEDAGISVSNEDLVSYFSEYGVSDDSSSYEEEYGLPYLKQYSLSQKVFDLIIETAVLI
ncbi:MAG: FKBP-type peptidyl-prolyl cis-trans isomerase [Desulfitobacteriaceae bacterium]|nr:FKBP-type peptidyl-prolyl cis-trans isomerase [Desulfitobacteriaceae bacterium]